MLRYRLFLALSRFVYHAPRRVGYGFTDLAAALAYLFNARARRVAEDNVRHALGPEATPAAVRAAVRGCFRAAARYYTDLARTPRMVPERFVRENLRTHGFEHIEAASRAGKGVIVATIHYGNPEYVAQSMSALGYRYLALTEPLRPQPLAELVQRLRSSQGQTFVEVGRAGIKTALRHLKSGGVVCIVCDRDIQHGGESVPFFGCTARIPSGAVDLARHTGATLVPAVTRRVGLDRFELHVEPPLELVRTGRVEEDRRANTAALIRRFEPYLRRDPTQWFVLEERIWPPHPVGTRVDNSAAEAQRCGAGQ
jgi:phosphatidylinositol dimannoside acyltransferase